METEGPRKQLRHNLRLKHKKPPEAWASKEGQLRGEKKKHGYLTKKGKRSRRKKKGRQRQRNRRPSRFDVSGSLPNNQLPVDVGRLRNQRSTHCQADLEGEYPQQAQMEPPQTLTSAQLFEGSAQVWREPGPGRSGSNPAPSLRVGPQEALPFIDLLPPWMKTEDEITGRLGDAATPRRTV